MKFMMTYTALPDAPVPTPEQFAAIGAFSERMIKAGTVVMTGGMLRPNHGIKIRCEQGKISVTDGPFAETKELIDGFAIVNVASQDEAIRVAGEFMQVAGDGAGEILRIYDEEPPPGAPEGCAEITPKQKA